MVLIFKALNGSIIVISLHRFQSRNSINVYIDSYNTYSSRSDSISSVHSLASQDIETSVCNELVNEESQEPDTIKGILVAQLANKPSTEGKKSC